MLETEIIFHIIVVINTIQYTCLPFLLNFGTPLVLSFAMFEHMTHSTLPFQTQSVYLVCLMPRHIVYQTASLVHAESSKWRPGDSVGLVW